MAVSITLTFDDTWAPRLNAMVVSDLAGAAENPIIVALLTTLGVTMESLTPKQRAKLWMLFLILRQLARFEGAVAATAAQSDVAADIEENFPLEVGEP